MYVGAEAASRRGAAPERGRRPALQDQGPATRASPGVGAVPAPHEPRRAAAALERAHGRHEPRRPAARSSSTRRDQITGWAPRRLDMTPGITGLWQVLGRNDIPFEEMVEARLPLRDELVALVGPQDPLPDDPGRARPQGGVLMATTRSRRCAARTSAGRYVTGADRRCSSSRRSTRRRTSRGCFADLEARARRCFAPGSRLIVVDDGSEDAHRATSCAAYAGRCRSSCVALGTNQGPGAAFRAGFAAALDGCATTTP